jgi:predicted amidophosphoribosyltransferase
MSTTHNNEETPRPEPVCPRCGNSEDAPNSHELCENCVEAMEDDGWDHWDRVRECDADAFADSIDRD